MIFRKLVDPILQTLLLEANDWILRVFYLFKLARFESACTIASWSVFYQGLVEIYFEGCTVDAFLVTGFHRSGRTVEVFLVTRFHRSGRFLLLIRLGQPTFFFPECRVEIVLRIIDPLNVPHTGHKTIRNSMSRLVCNWARPSLIETAFRKCKIWWSDIGQPTGH
jgi:hypothetical protein